ncbi:hypothetical protein C8T65DRAFT_630855 [Cerioporus squamosus]|nr:hypothetical protein C8T65DRAFT_630855 [Cerioporus squamosus]
MIDESLQAAIAAFLLLLYVLISRSKPVPEALKAHESLRRYAKIAVLPRMQVTGESSTDASTTDKTSTTPHVNLLQVMHETHRVLRTMHSMEDFLQRAVHFNALHMPKTPIGESDDDFGLNGAIRIPVPGYDIRLHHGRPTHLDDIEELVMFYPLQTIRRIMQLVYSDTTPYYLRTLRFDRDAALMRCIAWVPESSDRIATRPAMLVFVQAPWILPSEDLEEFASCTSFPDSRQHYMTPLNIVQRLWAKIYDRCSRHGSRWFVLTTYDDWVFGVFSRGYTQAWVSNVLHGQSLGPTILECLFYWFASAAGSPSGWRVPDVRAELSGSVARFPATTRSAYLRYDGGLDGNALRAAYNWP